MGLAIDHKCCNGSILLLQGDKSVRVMRSLLAAQQTFVDRLVQLMKAVQRESGNRKKKVWTKLLWMITPNKSLVMITLMYPVCFCRRRGCRLSWLTTRRWISRRLSPSHFLWSLRLGLGASSLRPLRSLRYPRTFCKSHVHVSCNWRILWDEQDVQDADTHSINLLHDLLCPDCTRRCIAISFMGLFLSVCLRVLWCQPSWSSRLRTEPCTQ